MSQRRIHRAWLAGPLALLRVMLLQNIVISRSVTIWPRFLARIMLLRLARPMVQPPPLDEAAIPELFPLPNLLPATPTPSRKRGGDDSYIVWFTSRVRTIPVTNWHRLPTIRSPQLIWGERNSKEMSMEITGDHIPQRRRFFTLCWNFSLLVNIRTLSRPFLLSA